MRSNKVWVLFAASFLAGLLSIWFLPVSIKDQFGHFLPFVVCGCLAVSLGMRVLASRLPRTDVTSVERLARRMFFKQSQPD